MILTHVGKFGDFIPSLTISNYYYKNNGEKTTFILSNWFKSIVGLEDFLLLQDFTEKVIFDSYVPENFNMGGQPYKFKPESLIDEVYYNLGMSGFPTRYLGQNYAEDSNLKYDTDMDLKFIDENFPIELRNLDVYSHFHEERWDKDRYEVRFTKLLPEEGYIPIDINKPLLYNLNLVHYSKNNLFYPNGFSVLVDMCKIQYKIINSSVNPNVYYLNFPNL